MAKRMKNLISQDDLENYIINNPGKSAKEIIASLEISYKMFLQRSRTLTNANRICSKREGNSLKYYSMKGSPKKAMPRKEREEWDGGRLPLRYEPRDIGTIRLIDYS